MATEIYQSSNYSKDEQEDMKLFVLQRDDAKSYFTSIIKPRLDRAYKLYIADNSDRAKEIQSWQSNVAVPYIHSVVETLKPRILDARPEFTAQGRSEDDAARAEKQQMMCDYTWEISGADKTNELVVSSSLIYGMGYAQVYWKKDVRTHQFLSTKDLANNKYKWISKQRVFYDAPFIEWVDNYSLWYDWHNILGENKQYWFKRLLLPEGVIKRKYPMADKKKLAMAFDASPTDLTDYADVRQKVKLAHEKITRGADYNQNGNLFGNQQNEAANIKLHEVYEWFRPFDDKFTVVVNEVPILKGCSMPFPYDFKETPFIWIPYLLLPGEFEGYGLPLIMENPQIMLNAVKNQRIDAMTLNIHKMWIVNPLANINKTDLVVRPFGIIYSIDPNGAREVQTSDIKPSAYKEEELLKGDMRYTSGVDDFSMGVGSGGSTSATEVRHLRESTLERVRLFINHMGDGYSKVMRYWMSMWRQFLTKKMAIRITGEDGETLFPFILPDDFNGEFDFKATVIPSIAGQNDIKKKQDMDLLQLLMNPELSFIDMQKLIAKILHDFSWNLKSISKDEGQNTMPIEPMGGEMLQSGGANVNPQLAKNVMGLLGADQGQDFSGQASGRGSFAEMSSPVNLLQTQGQVPPTPRGIPGGTTNPRGLNMGGKVNTNLPNNQNANPESSLLSRTFSLNK